MDSSARPRIYVFGWPSDLGGADTKLAHLLDLLRDRCELTVIPNEARLLRQANWVRFLAERGIRSALLQQLPPVLEGFALALGNPFFFSRHIAHEARRRGLRVIWSSEMTWHHEGELEAVKAGIVDKVLYTSEFQKSFLAPGYGSLESVVTGNYIDARTFPFCRRANQIFTIGRLSRATAGKYPEDFPVFYECLDLPQVRFRVMAWSDALRHKYRWHRFDDRWELLSAGAETSSAFLSTLDLFVYPLGHKIKESWGRSTVEAMLTGAIPIVPDGHQFDQFIVEGESGFICSDIQDYRSCCHRLYQNSSLRNQIASQARRRAIELCDPRSHLDVWMSVFK